MIITGLASAGAASGNALRVLALFQPDMINTGNAKLLEAFVIVTAVSFFIIMIVIVALALAVLKAKNELMSHVRDLKAKAMPLIEKSHGLVTDLTPEIKKITTQVNDITVKVKDITGHVGEIVVVAKDKVNEFSPTISEANVTFRDALAKAKVTFDGANETVQEAVGKAKATYAEGNKTVLDANEKTRQQIDRVNGMVSGALDATVKLGKAIEHGITQPGRELAGLVSGAKATVDNLLHQSSGLSQDLVGKISSFFAKKVGPKVTA